MNIENDLLAEYINYIKSKSIYSSIIKILPNTPQSFSSFPTIIFKEANNYDNTNGKSTNNLEYTDYLIYQVEIYSKSITFNGKNIPSRTIVKELEFLTHDFFRQCNFERNSSEKGEYIDLTIDRHIMTFVGTINNWNLKIN